MEHRRYILAVVSFLLTSPLNIYAGSGSTDYSFGTGSLQEMATFITAVMTIVVDIVMSVAAIVASYGAIGIYIKWMNGEEGLAKSIYIFVGAFIFLIACVTVVPSMFGFGTLRLPVAPSFSWKIWN